jgi:peptide/nickel transport system ATP-binding protein
MEDSSEKLAEIRGLPVTYAPIGGPSFRALDGVSLDIFPGDVIGLLGESGSGKSTLATSLLRLLPTGATCEGSLRFEDRDVLTMKEAELRNLRGARISLVPQDPAVCLNPVMRVGDQVSEVLRVHGVRGAKLKERVRELLREVCLDPERIYAAYPHELSGGQRQRVVIVQAIACAPALVIADEPTSKLDAAVQGEILELLSKLLRRRASAMMLITHDPAIVAGFCNRAAVMYAGRIVEEGKTEDVFRRPLHPYTQGLLSLARSDSARGAPPRTPFVTLAGEPLSGMPRAAACRFAPRCPERMQVCTVRDPKESAVPDSHRVSCFLYGH